MTMARVRLNIKEDLDDSYEIVIDEGTTLNLMIDELKKSPLGNKYAIISDDNVKKFHGISLLNAMKENGLVSVLISFKAGEESKNLRTFEYLHENLLINGIDRKSCIIALGGGVVGDIAGFVAGTYMRGIPYIQVPTTLLAQVDSSIGGKVAVDLRNGKNMCGVFYQPKRVYIDTNLLRTLPKNEVVNGAVEIIKHAIIYDGKFFSWLERDFKDILNLKSNALIKTIKRSCEIKAEIVEQDTYEDNLRKILNYGHTIAHALETLTNYKKYTHGGAVAIGMAIEGKISNLMGWLKDDELKRQDEILKSIGLKLSLPNIPSDILIKELSKDKKSISGDVYFA
ncbi:MAG: 3-dehydroquinate synthase, partial [Nanoarchaeota archaeon]